MFATSDGYFVPDFWAKAFAALFWLGLNSFGFPSDFGRFFSHTGLSFIVTLAFHIDNAYPITATSA